MKLRLCPILALALNLQNIQAFSTQGSLHHTSFINTLPQQLSRATSQSPLYLSENANDELNPNDENAEKLSQTFGGYTVKQRLREEVESPFRKVRLAFFATSTASALLALYFSFLATVKANIGGYSDAVPIEEALTNVGINVVAVVVCGYVTYTDYKKGEANLARIKQGGALAKLAVGFPEGSATTNAKERGLKTLSDFRRGYRVMICAGGKERIEEICRSLCSDQLKDENTLPEKIQEVDVFVIPVLLTTDKDGNTAVGDTRRVWMDTVAMEGDRNFDATRANSVVGFPQGNAAWADYLQSDVKTASGQGFDVIEKGIALTVKKNGRILSRVTGMPKWGDLVGTMDVLDGSKFGMPGDSEKYGGP